LPGRLRLEVSLEGGDPLLALLVVAQGGRALVGPQRRLGAHADDVSLTAVLLGEGRSALGNPGRHHRLGAIGP
jgi:hypothetical protein